VQAKREPDGQSTAPTDGNKTQARLPLRIVQKGGHYAAHGTDHLSELCANGAVFENAYSAPTCSPTRATIMTGRYGSRTGVGAVLSRENDASLSPDEVTLFDRLNEANYAAAVFGKWHLTSDANNLDHPKQLGVETFFGLFSGGLKSYDDWRAVENGRRVRVDGYSTSAIADRAIDWIAAQDDPWFAWLAFNAPHTPFHLPPAELHSFDTLSGSESDIENNPKPYYFAALEALDTELGPKFAYRWF